MTAILLPVTRGNEVVERRSSAWSDPKTWISILGLLLTILILVGGVIAKQLTEINSHLQQMEVAQGKTNTHNEDQINYLDRDQKKINDFLRDQNAYNFNVNKAVTEMATTMRLKGMPTPQIPEPPKLGGQ